MAESNTNPNTPLPLRLYDLIDQYQLLESSGEINELNETSIREQFLNPFLEELGWDPRNRRGVPPIQRDVVLEDKLLVDGSVKAPDYGMIINNKRVFYVEAKRPSVNVEYSTAAAYQIRRYSWSANLPLGLLSDFEEFAIYDCRQMPKPDDDPKTGRLLYFKYTELPEKWDDIYSLFSKNAVEHGSLENFVNSSKEPINTRPIDEAFLSEIRSWRISIAENIAKHNASLTESQLNRAVQLLLDRIIFLRIAEARGLEQVEGLRQAAISNGKTYDALIEMFQRADERYNSGLFHLSGEDSHNEEIDTISTMLTIDDVVLDTIIEKTYYPNPFEFSALPADILGQIYEQFLSERIELTNNRKVQVNLKPDLRKSGGVYYTPRAVVDYIVASTLDPILDGRDHLEVDKLKILDPSCGSGSFLISVYQYLIDWYTDFYSSKPRLAKKYLEIAPDNSLRLKTFKRKQILVNNIYGIDIDAQATEVTKLSLLLKVIEGQNQMELNVGRILPDLDGNIACGNTLIDIDFTIPVNNGIGGVGVYNPFSWSKTWPEIAINGGFDAVVGNPPYLNVDAIWGKNDLRTAYLKSKYSEIYQDKTDLLFYFLKRAHELTKGDVCFIVSRSFLESAKASKLRTWLSENARIREVIDFRKANVFPGVGINTAIVHYTKSLAVKSTNFLRYKNRDLPKAYSIHDLKDSDAFSSTTIPFTDLSDKSWNFGSEEVNTLNKKIDFQGQPIGQILHIGKGMETGRNSAFTTAMTDEEFHFLHQRGLAFKRARNSVIKRYKFDGDCPILFSQMAYQALIRFLCRYNLTY